MKKFLFLPLISLLLIPSLAFADAQVAVDESVSAENAQPIITEDLEKHSVTSINNYFELELIRGSQNPLNKNITYTLKITPKIEAYKTQIIWDAPTTIDVKPRHSDFANLNKDQTYTFKAVMSPERGGTYDVAANAISWLPEGNFTNSVSSTITLSNNNIVQPIDSAYTIGLILIFITIIGALGGLIFLGYKMSDKVLARIKIWLTPPV